MTKRGAALVRENSYDGHESDASEGITSVLLLCNLVLSPVSQQLSVIDEENRLPKTVADECSLQSPSTEENPTPRSSTQKTYTGCYL